MTRSLRVVVLLLCTLTVVSVLRASLPQVATGQWTPALDMADARNGAASVLLANGDTLIAGGSNSAGTLQTADIYQIDGSLMAAATMATGRSRHTATLLQDGRVLVAGGDSGTGTATNSAEIYDPGSDTWNAVGTLVSARFGHTATLLPDGRVAIVGGESNGSPVVGIDVFDPNTGLFTQPASLNVARKDHAAALLADGRLLVAGGFGVDAQNNQLALSSVEIFDPATNAVSAAANLNTARGRHSATVVLDGFVVVAGGSDGQADLNSIEIYTPATDSWAVSPTTLSVARNGHVATRLAKNNSVLISGGSSNGTALQNAEIFQPWTGSEVTAGNMSAVRMSGTGSSFGAEGLYLAAGGSGSKTTEFFRFATIKTDKDDYAPGTPVLMSGTGYQPNEVVGLNLKQDDGDADINVSVQADAAGNISYQGFAPDPGDVGTHFHLTAVGQTSGFQAQTVFTDAQIFSVRFAGTGSGSVTGSGFNCTDTAGVATGTCNVGGFNNKNPINLTAVTGGSISGWVITAGDATVTSGCTSGSTTCNLQMGNQASTVTLTINKASQTISFGALAGKAYGDADFTVSATASSGLAVSFSSQTTGVCTVSASTVHIVAAGSCTIRASQAGDSNHLAAPDVDQSFTVAQKSITATVTANNKVYDATTTATQNTCTLSGVVPADSANVTCSAATLSFADKNAGTAKAVSVSVISLSGTAATNYQLSSTAASASANITARPLTVTAATNTKIYDGGLAAAALPAITSGALQGSDSANFTETYDTKSAGGSKTLTPSGTVNDGNSGNNYAYTFVNDATGVITARALTITAAPNTKVYDGTASAAAVPTISTGALQGTDTAGFLEIYDTKHVGATKTLTPSGTANDGNGGNNYTYTFVNNGAGVITARPITVTATSSSKVYDGTTSAVPAPTITTGTLAAGDTATLTESYDNKNAGTGKTLIPAATIKDPGSVNVTSDYNVTLSNDTTGIITPRTITVTAASDSKIYDATTSSAGVPAISAPGIGAGDTAAFVQAFDTKNAGTAKTLTPSGSVTDGNSGHNYAVTFANNSAGIITPRPLTVTASANTKIYDGTISAGATPAITTGALQGTDTATFSETYDTKNAASGKTLTPAGTVSDGNGGNNYNVTFTAVSTGVVNRRALAVSATADNKIYDGNANAIAHLTDDRVTGDALTSAYATAAFIDKNVGTAKVVNVTGINVTGADSGNYTFNSSATAAASITPRDLTVTATADNKIYDRTTNAVAHLADNRIGGDILTASYTAAAFADRTVGNGKTVTVSGISISGADAGNYNLTNAVASALASITPRTVTPVIAASNKVYDRLTTATLSSQSVSGFIAPDVVSLAVTAASFDTKNAGSGKTVTATGLSLNGADAGNYSLNGVNSATTTADILQRPLNVTAAGVDRIYDGTVGASVTLSDDRIPGDILTESYSTASFANKNVGSNKPVSVSGIAISGLDAGNYSLNNTTASATANISPRSLTVSATGVSKVYDGTAAATVTLADDRIPGDLITDSYASAIFADKSVANGKPVSVSGISISGVDSGNYTFNGTAGTSANITPRPLHISATGVSRAYDGTTVAPVTLADDRVSGDAFADSYTSASFADKNAANAKPVSVVGIAISGPDAGNYSANSSAATIADITARPITVSATSDSKVYDATTSSSHSPGITIGSVAAGDSASFSQAFDSKNAGARTLTASGSVNDGNGGNNYSISFATAAGSITQRPLTVTAAAVGKIYDGTTTASVTLSDNHLSGDSVSDTDANAAFNDKNVGTGKLISVTGISLSGADAGNYSLTSTTASTTADITARTLTVSAHGIDKPYDGGTAATVTLSDDRVSGDLVTDSYVTASFADKNVGAGKPVSVSSISISGADATNYALASTSATTSAAINVRSLTVSAAGIGKIYDGTTIGSVTLSDNRVAGDVFTDSYSAASFADKNAGASKAIAVSGISISGPDAGNYSLANITAAASADISPLGLTIAAVTDSKVYDGATGSTGIPHATPALVSGDSGIFSQTFSNKNAGNSKLLVPAASITDGNGGNNYAVTLVNNSTGIITPRGLAVNASASDKVYDGTTSASVSLTDNRLSGDLFTINLAAANFVDQNAGLGKTVTVSGISLSGQDAGNYTPNTSAAATASILQRPITVAADSKTRIFGTPDPALTYQITSGSLVSGDSFTGNLARAAGSTVGSYAIGQGTLALNSNYMLSFIGSSFTITPAATTITLNPAATITLGQTTLPVSATVHAVLPSTAFVSEGSVTFTLLQGSTIVASAASGAVSGGAASANLAVSALPVGSYTVQATFNPPATGANFMGSSSTVGVSAGVQYNVCLLYDGTKSVKSGATYPVKIYLCDINNRDVSASGIITHAISASMLSGWSGPPEDAGNSNPDLDFRYDPTLGPSGGYIFNLKTTGLGAGTYSLNFSAGGDPANHSVPFGVK